jgi:hypothetical protein
MTLTPSCDKQNKKGIPKKKKRERKRRKECRFLLLAFPLSPLGFLVFTPKLFFFEAPPPFRYSSRLAMLANAAIKTIG